MSPAAAALPGGAAAEATRPHRPPAPRRPSKPSSEDSPPVGRRRAPSECDESSTRDAVWRTARASASVRPRSGVRAGRRGRRGGRPRAGRPSGRSAVRRPATARSAAARVADQALGERRARRRRRSRPRRRRRTRPRPPRTPAGSSERPSAHERAAGAVVDDDPARRAPARTRSRACGSRGAAAAARTTVPTGSPVERVDDDVGRVGGRDHRAHARPRGDLRRRELARHPAAPPRRCRCRPRRASSAASTSTISSMSDALVVEAGIGGEQTRRCR